MEEKDKKLEALMKTMKDKGSVVGGIKLDGTITHQGKVGTVSAGGKNSVSFMLWVGKEAYFLDIDPQAGARLVDLVFMAYDKEKAILVWLDKNKPDTVLAATLF